MEQEPNVGLLRFANLHYNIATRPFGKEFLFDCEENLSFFFGTFTDIDNTRIEIRYYLKKRRLIKVLVKKRGEGEKAFATDCDSAILPDRQIIAIYRACSK